MKLKFNNQSSGYGMFPEAAQFRLFRNPICFQEDNGAGSNQTTPPTTPPEPGKPPEDVSGLKSALDKERSRAEAMERQFKQLQESVKGIDPEKYKQFEALQASAEEWNKKEAAIRQESEAERTRQVQAEQAKAQAFETKYNSLLQRTAIEKAYQAANGRPGGSEDMTFFEMFYATVSNRFKLNDKGEVEVLDTNGVRLFSKKDASKPMSPVEFFADLQTHAVYGNYFMAKNNPRGGAMPPNANGFTSRDDLSKLPRAERLTMAREQAGH